MDRSGHQHRGVPQRLLVRQAARQMEDRAQRIDHAACEKQDQACPAPPRPAARRPRTRRSSPSGDRARPTAISMRRGCRSLAAMPARRRRPHHRREAARPRLAQLQQRERRIGAGDHDEDRRVIEPPQPLAPRAGEAKIVGGRAAQHRQQPRRHRRGSARPVPASASPRPRSGSRPRPPHRAPGPAHARPRRRAGNDRTSGPACGHDAVTRLLPQPVRLPRRYLRPRQGERP